MNAVAFAAACGAFALPLAWILSLVRIEPPRYYSGAGSFIGMIFSTLVIGILAFSFANWVRRVHWTHSAEEALTELSDAA
jgi:hypothetical protein